MSVDPKAAAKDANPAPGGATTKPDQKTAAETGLKSAMDKAEISLILDTYDDIFSDFDPRPYNERALSEDFLIEARKAARDKTNGIELRFLIPAPLQDKSSEERIKQRLKSHFRKHYRLAERELIHRRRLAVVLISIGVIVGILDVILITSAGANTFMKDSIDIVLAPASWYTLWNGFDNLLVKPKDVESNMRFYKKMVGSSITFAPY